MRGSGVLRVVVKGRVSITDRIEFVEMTFLGYDPQVIWQTRPYQRIA